MTMSDSGEKEHFMMRNGAVAVLGAVGLGLLGLLAMPAWAQDILLRPEPAFKGKIERTVKGSVPDFPKAVEAPKGAPNVLLILTDDVGFGATSPFGGPIQTPTFDRRIQ